MHRFYSPKRFLFYFSVVAFAFIIGSSCTNNSSGSTEEALIVDAKDGFAMSVVREDSTGGRSVKRIYKMEVF